jgi:hypothetical protein
VKFKLLFAVKTGLLLLVSFMPCAAHAKLIKFTMDMEVSLATNSPYLTVAKGDTFQFIAIYDDESQHAYAFNGSLVCLAEYASLHPSECDVTSDKLDWLDNPTLNIGDLFDVEEMIKDGGAFWTDKQYYWAKAPFSFAVHKIEPDVAGYHGITFSYFSQVVDGAGKVYVYEHSSFDYGFVYFDNNNKLQHDTVHYTMSNLNYVAYNVPEPSTLAIFALGIMGLASRR